MNNKPKIAVLGGDMRQYAAAKKLIEYGASVHAYALCVEAREGEAINICEELADTVSDAAALILPLPASADGKTLNCPAHTKDERTPLERIIEHMSRDSVLFGGRIPSWLTVRAEQKGIRVRDYFLSEKLQIKNAYLTAEAALSIAMNSLDKCVRDARVAVTGSGRISRLLAELLRRLGADVTVAARNEDALTYFELLGCHTLSIKPCANGCWYDSLKRGYDIIFNTVPSWLFDRDFLESADRKTLFIELASAPGGVDVCAARELGSNVLWASSLPGKYAPESAGILIADCVWEIMREEGCV